MTWLSALKALLIALPEILRGVRSIADMISGWKKSAELVKKEQRIAKQHQLVKEIQKLKITREERRKLVEQINSLN